jgi:signal transduction histidine kinase
MDSGPASERPRPEGLWTVLNRPRPVDPRTIQVLCGFHAAAYLLLTVVHHDPAHPSFDWVRGGIGLTGVVGMMLAPRFDFAGARAFAIAMVAMTSLGVGYVGAVINDLSQLPLTGLATFVITVFLQTGLDVAVVVPLLAIGHATILAVWPPAHETLNPTVVMIGAALLTGSAVSIMISGYSGRLNERVTWWQNACERERAALRAKSEFLSTMSHELRSPLHVIVGYADIVEEAVEPHMRDAVAGIRRSALDLLQLVENTMNAARLEAGRLALHAETFEPAAVFRELAENVAALPEAKRGVPVRWAVAPGLPPVHLDRLKLKEIVQNLVSNALKFTTEGEVVVEAIAEPTMLRLAVRDTGPGIDAASQATIFDMFERVEASGSGHRPPGVGLGLYIVRSLVGLMGGTIAVESAPGAGTCFTVRLPLRTPDVAKAA